jgi:hypothetical protein
MKKFISLILVVTVCVKLYAQNATIIYQGSTLSNINNCSSCCNVFNQSGNNPKVGGFSHYSVSGGATFDGTSIKMQTQVNIQSNKNTGTAYAIGYTFKTGYSYIITIDMGYTANPNTAFPALTLSTRQSLPNPNDTDPISCGPVQGAKYSSSVGSVIYKVYPSQTAVKTYTIPTFSVIAQATYLILTVSDGGPNGTTALINKITITESLPLPSFTLSSNSTSVACGSTTPVTFTAAGSNIPAGATVAYTWNLGANNGWRYNNAAAPATISTSTNQIALTPVCGSALSSVSATATVNGTPYNAAAISVSIAKPVFTIDGGDAVCNSSTYTLSSALPCGATVTWAASPAGKVSLAASGNQVTLTKIAEGNINLTATISNACGNTATAFRNIRVGSFSNNEISIGGPTTACPYQSANYAASLLPGASYSWFWSGDWTYSYGQGTNGLSLDIGGNPFTGVVGVQISNACGVSGSPLLLYVTVNTCSWMRVADSASAADEANADSVLASSKMAVYPNPATNEITITAPQILQEQTEAVFVNMLTNDRAYSKTLPKGKQQITLSVGHLRKGQYALMLKNKKGNIIKTWRVVLQ